MAILLDFSPPTRVILITGNSTRHLIAFPRPRGVILSERLIGAMVEPFPPRAGDPFKLRHR